ncbi:MAG: hypothetical protein ACREMY_20575 [bacterium]
MATNWRGMSEEQLIEYADRGMGGSGAAIEMLRRMQNRGLNRLYVAIGIATVVMAALQVVLAYKGLK